jgi:hypothetical protein
MDMEEFGTASANNDNGLNSEISPVNCLLESQDYCESLEITCSEPTDEILSDNQILIDFNDTNMFDFEASVLEPEDLYLSVDDLQPFCEDASIEKALYEWKLKFNVSRNALTGLLHILQPECPYLPSCADTLIAHVNQKPDAIVDMHENGEFIWFGIAQGIKKLIPHGLMRPNIVSNDYSQLEDHAFSQGKSLITVQISVDGIPLFKSSRKSLWPILIKVNESCIQGTFIAGAFYGISKPSNLADFLSQASAELSNLLQYGLVINHIEYVFHIFAFVCDSPARSFIKGTKYCTGYHSCDYCTIRGEHINRKVVFLECDCPKRTDAAFAAGIDVEHHNYASPLTQVMGLGMVSRFPPEPMHCCYLGVVKRLLTFWVENLLRPSERKHLSDEIEELGKQLPKEFKRKVRGLSCLKFWKATEFRNFILYVFPNISKTYLPKAMYDHCLLLHFALYFLSTSYFSSLADQIGACLKKFVVEVQEHYSDSQMVYNVHILLHLTEYACQLGPLDFWSAFGFESFLYYIKLRVHRPSGVLSQLKSLATVISKDHCNESVQLCNKWPNNFAMTNVGIISVLTVNGSLVTGYKCQFVDHLYNYPYTSQAHGIGNYQVLTEIVSGVCQNKCVAFSNKDDISLFTIVPFASHQCFT